MNALAVLLQAFVDIALFRRGPQDLPAASVLLYPVLAFWTLLNTVIAGFDLPAPYALLVGLENTIVPVVFTAFILRSSGRPGRIPQTLTALAGTGALINIIAMPVVYAMAEARRAGTPVEGVALAWLLVFVWSLFVSAHIYRHALNTRLLVGFLLTLVLLGVLVPVVQLSLPPQPLAGG